MTEENSSPAYKLFTSRAISAGAFLGGPLAVTVLLANNFGRMGDNHNRNRTYILGLGITLSMIWILMTIPQSIMDRIPSIVFPAISSWIAYFLTEKLQGEIIREHFKNLGAKASGWAVFGWSMLSLAIYLGLALLLIPFVPPFDFEEESYSEGLQGNKIHYSENIDTRVLKNLGEYLLEVEYFDSEVQTVIQLVKSEAGYSLTFSCYKDLWDDQETIDSFKEFGEEIAADLNMTPLSISLVDEDFGGIYRKVLD